MNTILVEGKFGHGAKLNSKKKHSKIHAKRPFVAMDSAPYDWTKPLTRNYSQPIKNQDQAGKCGGALYSQFKQIFNTLALGKPFVELSMDAFYSQQYASGGGMTIVGMQDGAGFTALTTTANVPDTIPCTEAQAESIAWRTPALMKACLLEAGMKMVSVPIDIDSMAQAIRDYYTIGMCIGGVNNGTWLSKLPVPPNIDSEPLWGHYMTYCPSIPAMTTEKLLPVYQSWGDTVGENGIQYFGEDYINSGFIYDVFTFVKYRFDKDFGFGAIGDDVRYLQVRLGILPSTFGFGMFGPKTLTAVKLYQAAHNIPQTGYVGPRTRASLNSA